MPRCAPFSVSSLPDQQMGQDLVKGIVYLFVALLVLVVCHVPCAEKTKTCDEAATDL